MSPMLEQYLATKANNPDCLLLFRLGDFYELFFEDAVTASRELDLVLTGKNCGMEERAPMCGVPFHAVDSYVAKLIEKGYKVAICEQLESPNKKLMKRDVVRIVTPGTVIENDMLSADKNNYLLSICLSENVCGVCWADISTGEFNRTTIDAQIPLRLNDLLSKIAPSEILCNAEMKMESANLSLVKYGGICEFLMLDESEFDLSSSRKIIPEMCKDAENILKESDACIMACGALLRYVRQTQKRDINYIRTVDEESLTMSIDSGAIKTLELLSCVDGKVSGSLYGVINKTETSMGARLLKKILLSPSNDEKLINARLESINELFSDGIMRGEVRKTLSGIFDLERLSARLSYGSFSPKDCISLKNSLELLPELKKHLRQAKTPYLSNLSTSIDTFNDLTNLIECTIKVDASLHLRDGNVICDGANRELDELRSVTKNAKKILSQLEASEKEKTGIRGLRIGFNNVFGYYIEVPKGQISNVPDGYIRKQTTVNTERYITEDLKKVEDKVLHAEENAIALEQKIYDDLLGTLSKYSENITRTSSNIALIDVLVANAEVASLYDYKRPEIGHNHNNIIIKGGRHATVERQKQKDFVPNDTVIDNDGKIMIITGPNMAGKSVYMRQVALIVILAHCGFFVPAESAEIPIIDKVFTRVGANDDLHTGRSTFMVEMSEVSYILNNISDNSLVLLDEVGRGTSTFDGLSIAWAIMEHLSNKTKAKVLFSTHYHELTELEGVLSGVKNYKITLKEYAGNIIFTHKLVRGSANRSFGIEVAALSGLPNEVVLRAKELLGQLEKNDITKRNLESYDQISMFSANSSDEILRILKDIDVDSLTPRDAFDTICDLKEKIK